VRYLLLCRNKIFRRLGIVLSNVFLLFVELVDDLILLCNFIIQRLDVVISTSLFLLNLVNSKLNIFNVLLDNIDRSSMLLSLSSQLNSGSLFSSQSVLHFSQLSFTIGLHFISLSLSVGVDAEISLLLLKGLGEGLDVILKGVHLSFKIGSDINSILVLTPSSICLLFQLSELLLRVGHTNKRTSFLDNDKPSPFSHGHILPEVALADLDEFSLISALAETCILDAFVDLSLQVSDQFIDNVVTSFLKLSKSTSSEEDQSVSKTVPLPIELNFVHESIDSSFVITGAVDFSSSKDSITHFVIRVHHSVGESSHADPDTFQYTIASELVHD